MKQLNPYNLTLCKQYVEQRGFEPIIKNKYGELTYFDYKIITDAYGLGYCNTPRRSMLTPACNAASFYYLVPLLESNPQSIVDVGCGFNFFKLLIPNLIGLDATDQADINRYFDQKWANANLEKFDAAFSMNALHFVPLNSFVDTVHLFSSIIRPGGKGYISFNVLRMVERSSQELLTAIGLSTPRPIIGLSTPRPIYEPAESKSLEDYIVNEIDKIKLKLLIVDVLISKQIDEPGDGNIRIVFEK